MNYSIKDLQSDFPTDEACLEWLVNYRYPDGVFCIQCDKITKYYPVRGRRTYACGACGWQISPMKGTVFENTNLPLTDWMYAIYLMSTSKAGVSAMHLQRVLGISYKAAFRMLHRIRGMMAASPEPLFGEVEIDETYVHANPYKNSKAMKRLGADPRRKGEVIVGMVQRGGAVKMWHIRQPKSAGVRVLIPLIRDNVQPGTLIHTDGYLAYRKLPMWGYDHRWTDHGAREWYREDSYTQNIENTWSHLKRGIKGIYRHVSAQWLQNYCNEFSWRYSNRNVTSMFWALLGAVEPQPVKPLGTAFW
jgi:transposase